MDEKRVLVFGTFDGLHPGHHFFLRSAKTNGTHLSVSVARDAHVRELKDKVSVDREQERLRRVSDLSFVDEAFLSDEELGTFSVLENARPDLIILGHDQEALEASLRLWMESRELYIPIKRLPKIAR